MALALAVALAVVAAAAAFFSTILCPSLKSLGPSELSELPQSSYICLNVVPELPAGWVQDVTLNLSCEVSDL